VTTAVMARGDRLSVTDGEATTIRIDRGCVWITEEGSVVDHVLEAGQRYTFDRPGVALVAAQNEVRVTLLAPRVGPRPARIACGKATLYFRPLWWDVIAAMWPASMRRASRRSFGVASQCVGRSGWRRGSRQSGVRRSASVFFCMTIARAAT